MKLRLRTTAACYFLQFSHDHMSSSQSKQTSFAKRTTRTTQRATSGGAASLVSSSNKQLRGGQDISKELPQKKKLLLDDDDSSPEPLPKKKNALIANDNNRSNNSGISKHSNISNVVKPKYNKEQRNLSDYNIPPPKELKQYKTPRSNSISNDSLATTDFHISKVGDSGDIQQGSTFSDVTIESLSERVQTLESLYRTLLARCEKLDINLMRNSRSTEPNVKLTQAWINIIRSIVQNDLFRICKFMDNNAELQLGPELVARVLRVMREDKDRIHERPLYAAIMSRAKVNLTAIKSHAKLNIRKKSASKYSLFYSKSICVCS